jgi:acylphosphatase
LVDGVTEQDKSLPRKERKIAYIKHLDWISYRALALSISDRIQNLRDMIKWLENHGNKMFEKFNAWFEEQKWFILSYSLKVKKIIDTLQDEKIKWKCLDLYKELHVLIGYFLEIGKNK